MRLYIDTSNAEKITIGINDRWFSTEARQEKSQKLLPFIVETLKGYGKTINDITDIEVVPGPGSFTGLRVGLSVANALGWARDVRVNTKQIAIDGPIEPIY